MSKDTIVRGYCSEDLGAIKEILSDYPSPTGRLWSNKLVERMITDALEEQPDGVFVAEKSGKVVGFAIVFHREWFNIAYLDYIQVKTKWMDKGIGHKLIESCIDWAKEADARIIYTETGEDNEGAIKFYQRHGFKITGSIPDYYKNDLDAVIMVRKLS
ncbi:GNAT family N-acetyltransferase [Candidatus Bathyarchaeota archaeon]|nr:GNAT family N-acetyltransferase [Candidatus Bathyarchaeota archaeon]